MAITSIMPILLNDADNAISGWAEELIKLIHQAESLSAWAETNLTEALRDGDQPTLVLGIEVDQNDPNIVRAIPWTPEHLASMQAQFQAAADFAAFMRTGGKASPLRRLQEIARPNVNLSASMGMIPRAGR